MVRPPVARQALLDAMRAELIENAAETDLSSVTRRAGVSTGAVYHHFGSKIGLLAVVYSDFFEGSERAVLDASREGGSWIERERRRVRAMVEYYFGDPLGRVVLQRNTEHSAVTELEASYLARAEAGVAADLREGQADGALPVDLDVEVTAAFLVGGLRRALVALLGRPTQPSVDEASELLWQLLAATLELRE
jgi:AcrR family transcriptional regulator